MKRLLSSLYIQVLIAIVCGVPLGHFQPDFAVPLKPLGDDRFMSEARAITNFIGNTVATFVIAKWDGEFDRGRGSAVLAG